MDNLRSLTASLRAHGQVKPLVVRQGVVIAGNGTLEAARALGWSHLACVEFAGSDLEARAFAIADNRTAELATWDDAILAESLRDLDDAGFLDATGFDEPAMADALDTADQAEALPDAEDPGPTEAQRDEDAASKPGEIYALGPHRLLCGDSTDADAVARLFGPEAPSVMVMDPPFDMSYEAWPVPDSVRLLVLWARGHTGLQWLGPRVGDAPLWGVSTLSFSGQARGWARPEWPCLVHEVVYLLRRGESRGVPARGAPARAYGLRVTEDDRPFSHYDGLASRRNDMSWAKNPACFAVAFCLTNLGETVWDPCAGSGASLLAAHSSGLRWIGAEVRPVWADMIRRRWTLAAMEAGVDAGSGALR